MSKSLKAGVAILLIGVTFIIAAVAIGGEDVFNMTAEKTRKEYTFTGDYTKISLDDYSSNIVVKQSTDNDIHLVTNESEDEYYAIDEGNELGIKYVADKNWTKEILTIGDVSDFQNTSELYLPADFNSDLQVYSAYGDIDLANITAKEITLQSDSGNIDLSRVKANDTLTITSNYGNVDIEQSQSTTNAEITSVDGSISLDECSFGNLTIESTYGKIDLSEVASQDDIILTSTDGSIIFDYVTFSSKLIAKSEYGNVSGDFNKDNLTDYTFDLSTTYGNAKLNDNDINNNLYGDGNKMVDITTTDGNIDITCNSSDRD